MAGRAAADYVVIHAQAHSPVLASIDVNIPKGVLVAINDQPISVRLAAEGRTQNDFVRDLRAVELRFFAGLRMSFGAPPRVFEPMPAFEDP